MYGFYKPTEAAPRPLIQSLPDLSRPRRERGLRRLIEPVHPLQQPPVALGRSGQGQDIEPRLQPFVLGAGLLSEIGKDHSGVGYVEPAEPRFRPLLGRVPSYRVIVNGTP